MARSLARSPFLRSQFADGVASCAALMAMGISSATIQRHCSAGGPWQRLCLGVVALFAGQPTDRQRMRAGLLHSGADAMLTGVTGARLYGVTSLPPDRRVHVLVGDARRVASREFVQVVRTTRLPAPRTVAGLPVAPVARCLVDAGSASRSLDDTRAMLADALQRGICTTEELRREAAWHRPGVATVRRVLAELDDGVRSTAEAWAREVILSSDLPVPAWNVALYTESGVRIGVVDGYWDEVGLAWEIQSRRHHLSPQAHRRDVEKQNSLVVNGVIVAQTMASRLRTDPRGVLDELRRAHALAASSPRPNVQARPWRP